MSKAPPKTVAFKDIAFVPRFEYGHMCTIGAVCGSAEGTVLETMARRRPRRLAAPTIRPRSIRRVAC